jgi:hypothetical protein
VASETRPTKIKPGTTAEPLYGARGIDSVPPPAEIASLLTGLPWSWIAEALDDGESVGIQVSPGDEWLLVDVIQARIGYDVVLRCTVPGIVWIVRPGVLEAAQDSGPTDSDAEEAHEG